MGVIFWGLTWMQICLWLEVCQSTQFGERCTGRNSFLTLEFKKHYLPFPLHARGPSVKAAP